MVAWGNYKQLVAHPDLCYGQLRDPPGPIFISIVRQITPESMTNMQALESKNHPLQSEVHRGKSWKLPVGAATGITPEIQIKQISNLIEKYISASTFKLLLSSNYLLP